MTRRALVLINDRARRGAQVSQASLDVLSQGGIDLLRPSEATPDSYSELIREHRDDINLVIVGGGDGSMNAAARGLVDTGLPLGILPCGTANDLARTLGLPVDCEAAAQVIVAGRAMAVDLGQVNDAYFFNVASVGFSARLARSLTARAKKRWGKLGYAIASVRLLSESRPFTAYIEHDGSVETVRTIQVSVGNGCFYGGGMKVAEDARPDDGMLDVYSIEVKHWMHLLALGPALRRGTHGRSDSVRTYRTTALAIRTRRPHEVNADGELVTATPAEFRVRRAAVRVFVPPRG